MMTQYSLQKGNILFLILIAVALFAALSYAVTSSMRGGTGSVSAETAQLKAAQLLNFMDGVGQQTMRMRVTDSFDPTELSFDAPGVYLLANGANNCWLSNTNCSSNKCQVFNTSNPSGIVPQVFDTSFTLTNTNAGRPMPGHLAKRQLAVYGVGSAEPDMIISINYLKPEICNAINAKLGFTTTFNGTEFFPFGGEEGTSQPKNFGGCATPAVWDATMTQLGDQYTQLAGRHIFCIPFDTATANLALVKVILER